MACTPAERLKQLRLARGLSLDDLANRMGGAVTKQALSQFENGKTAPSARTLISLAKSLGVSTANILQEPACEVEFVAYRKLASLGAREQKKIEARVRLELENYVKVQQLTATNEQISLPKKKFQVSSLADAETAAERLRQFWNIGGDPIGNLVSTLEDKHVYVCRINTDRRFDGVSAFASEGGRTVAAMVVTHDMVAGERQRMNIAHELGHLVLEPTTKVDEEKAAFRFAGSFLAPAADLLRETGPKRSNFEPDELLLLKKKFGISLQALIYRLRELEVISENCAKSWWIRLNRLGWRKEEPEPLTPEQPMWLRRQVLRAVAEGALSHEAGSRILGETLPVEEQAARRVRDLMRKPLAARRRLLSEQAERAAPGYEVDNDWLEMAGDVHED